MMARHAPSMLLALQHVLSPGGFPYASGYHLFKDAYFGRDSLEVAEDLLEPRPEIARAVILRLTALQGTGTDSRTEEQPGKIHHEYRALILNGSAVDESSQTIFRQLAKYWQAADTVEGLAALTEIINYFTVDATPLYVRLVSRYCGQMGSDILDEEYRGWRENEGQLTIRDRVRWAVEWIAGAIEQSELGLLEFQRMTPRGHRFQAWKDGATSYLHTDGSFANCNAPIASIEVQGLAYDALIAAPTLLDLDAATARERECWTSLAQRLRDSVMEYFWMPDRQFFAMALDRHPQTGEARQVRTMTSSPGALLDSGIFDALPPDERQRAVTAIVDRIYSDEFLTPVGVRCHSMVHQTLQDYMAYQGSCTVWHKETYDIAKGLRRQGFPALAMELEVRFLNAVNLVGGATEFLYVLPDGRADLDPFRTRPKLTNEEICGTNIPENDQAWSISAALAIKWRRGHQVHQSATGGWQREIEKRKAREIPPVPLLRTYRDIERAREAASGFSLNVDEGWRRERAFARDRELPTPPGQQ